VLCTGYRDPELVGDPRAQTDCGIVLIASVGMGSNNSLPLLIEAACVLAILMIEFSLRPAASISWGSVLVIGLVGD
jgi:hypothetical protein